MTRKLFGFAVMALMLAVIFSGTAGADEAGLATPTDLTCAHEHTKTTIYFFDTPDYTPVDEESHRVSGPATIETVCLDCGDVLSSETVNYTEEIRSHSTKNGVCALCGYSKETLTVPERKPAAEKTGEKTIYARKDEIVEDLQTLTISSNELSAIKDSGTSTLLIRGNSGSAAIALKVTDILAQTKAEDEELYLELAEREDGSLFANLYLVSASGERRKLSGDGITLRVYQENCSGVRASVVPADSDQMMETEAEWDGSGYWSIQYLEEGTYFILQ